MRESLVQKEKEYEKSTESIKNSEEIARIKNLTEKIKSAPQDGPEHGNALLKSDNEGEDPPHPLQGVTPRKMFFGSMHKE